MVKTMHKLEICSEELAVIESALHTQSKILSVQANAGGDDALAQLNQVKRALASIAQQKPCVSKTGRPCKIGWFGMSRIFG